MMKNKVYQSFEEIDTDLKILKLKKEIDMLQLKNSAINLKKGLSFKGILSETFSSVGLSLLNPEKRWIRLAADYVLYRFFRRK